MGTGGDEKGDVSAGLIASSEPAEDTRCVGEDACVNAFVARGPWIGDAE